MMNLVCSIFYRCAVGAVLAFITLPLIVVVVASFSPTTVVEFRPWAWTMYWYGQALEWRWIEPLFLSVKLAFLVASLSGLLGFLAAYALVYLKCPGSATIMAILLSPLSVPQIVKGVAIVLFLSATGFFDWLGTPALIAAHIVLTLPFVLRMCVSAMYNFDAGLDRAARILGASRLESVRYVMLPLVKAGVFSGMTLAFVISFNNIPLSLFLVQPGQTTLPIKVVNHLEYSLDPVLAAVNVISMTVILLIIWIFQKLGGFSTNIHGGTK